MILNAADEGSTTLSRLPIGQAAVVREVIGTGPELVRLRVMGVCGGQGVHVLRTGPRMIVCVGGTRLGIDRDVANCVKIVVVDPADPVEVQEAMQEAIDAAVVPAPQRNGVVGKERM